MKAIRVLLVDDEESFLSPLVKRLTKRNFEVQSAVGGVRAIEKIEQSPVDVVVLDVKMPDMDGLTVLEKIKEIDPTVEVIMLTGHAGLDVALRGMRLGAFDYLIKPAELDELVYKLEDAAKMKACKEGTGECTIPQARSRGAE